MTDVTEQPLAANICWLLSRASYNLTTELTAALEDVDMSPRAHEVLIAAASGEHTQTALVHLVGLDKTTLMVTLDQLEQAGLVERKVSSHDRRARVITLTAAGKRKLDEADQILDRIRGEVLESLPAGERTALVSALQRLMSGRLATPAATSRPVRRRAPRT